MKCSGHGGDVNSAQCPGCRNWCPTVFPDWPRPGAEQISVSAVGFSAWEAPAVGKALGKQ